MAAKPHAHLFPLLPRFTMILFRSLLACCLAVAVLVPASISEGAKAKAKKKKGSHPVAGLVTAVDQDKEKKNQGTVTLKIAARKKKKGAPAATPTEATEKKFTITSETKFVKVTGKKKEKTESPASFDDVKSGSRIMVLASQDGKAEKVSISEAKKGKKKKKNQ
jgi:hypothetical protein